MGNKSSEVEVGVKELCPCGSGKPYGKCCKKRNFRWVRDSRGRISKNVRLTKEAIEIFQRADQRFRETFGRKQRASDPVFFEKYYTSERDFNLVTFKAMKAAGVAPSVLYASRKTGFLVTKDRRDMLSTEEEREWNAAIDEYYDAIESGADPKDVLEGDKPPEFLQEYIRRNQIVSGYFIDKHYNRYRRKKSYNEDVEMVAAFAATSFTRSLKSIHILLENNVSFDAYHVLRALYENYLTLKYVYQNPKQVVIFLAQLGVLLGTHSLAISKAGTPIQNELVETSTGVRTVIPSRWTMASTLGAFDQELYNQVYRKLSSYSHSEITNIQHFVSRDGFDYLSPNFEFDVMMTCHLLSMLFYACLKEHSPCAAYLKRDLAINVERSLLAIGLMDKFLLEATKERFPEIYIVAMGEVIGSDARLKAVYDSVVQSALP